MEECLKCCFSAFEHRFGVYSAARLVNIAFRNNLIYPIYNLSMYDMISDIIKVFTLYSRNMKMSELHTHFYFLLLETDVHIVFL